MEFALAIIEWLKGNMDNVVAVVVAFIAFAEAVTRITPTEKDDGFVKRLGEWVDKALKWLPNNVKK